MKFSIYRDTKQFQYFGRHQEAWVLCSCCWTQRFVASSIALSENMESARQTSPWIHQWTNRRGAWQRASTTEQNCSDSFVSSTQQRPWIRVVPNCEDKVEVSWSRILPDNWYILGTHAKDCFEPPNYPGVLVVLHHDRKPLHIILGHSWR